MGIPGHEFPPLTGHNFAACKGDNPACSPEARYKAVAGGRDALYASESPDGIRWSRMVDQKMMTQGLFDAQNVAFWDAEWRVEQRPGVPHVWPGFKTP